ncbi:hypothetical protein HYPSUDRAFT_54069 [Hypholoma sublateritium FD-334 SS-4]|uniref:Uncharacterized protein n=1 Tax=Hypholoma sublateritium (strain FD-334 SS-4) TaxID=945553 RepID=A0A0D2L9J0_HYPSF|nr:hypothetical protein HYPSUDRAFT_54069 [Hypholoma sublateritium FD-334 SS-4]
MPKNSPQKLVEWAKNPNKSQSLLDWLDANEYERKVLFNHKRIPLRLNKVECGQRAAAALFSDDIDLKAAYAANPRYFSNTILDHLRHWGVKYRRFNRKIGSWAARIKYKDIPKGPLRDKINKLMLSTFPQWSRIHVYWRTDSYYNTFWSGKEPNNPPPKSLSPKCASKVVNNGTIVSQKKPTPEYIVIEDTPSPRAISPDCSDGEIMVLNRVAPSLKIR